MGSFQSDRRGPARGTISLARKTGRVFNDQRGMISVRALELSTPIIEPLLDPFF